MKITCRMTENEEEYAIARQIRTAVFVGEQKVTPEDEFDNLDDRSFHALAFVDDTPVATARITFFDDSTKLGRVAVFREFRGMGAGTAIMHFIIEVARKEGKRPVYGHGQSHAVEFYERLGFRKEGDEFEEAGIKHYRMVLE